MNKIFTLLLCVFMFMGVTRHFCAFIATEIFCLKQHAVLFVF